MSDEKAKQFDDPRFKGNRLPFGDPDGARADLEKASLFVSLDDRQFASGIAASDLDRSIRVIVGKKGAGKTIYLRRLQDSARKEDSIFASRIAKDIPPTNAVIEFCQSFNAEKVTEAWQHAWRVAILMSAASLICNKTFFAAHVDQDRMRGELDSLIAPGKVARHERSTYSELKNIISSQRSEKAFWDLVTDAKWDDFQIVLGSQLKVCPPLFIYLDASDDEFAHAPMEWHRCQKGLFYAVMRLLSLSGAIASRLHVVIAIRDIVYSSVLRSEHRTRYINSPSISLLDWSKKSILYFLHEKIAALGPEYFSASEERSIYGFLGLRTIYNSRRSVEEDASSYLLRHTRALPRDIVQMGNAIAAEKLDFLQGDGSSPSWEERLRKIISGCASVFGQEQIEICANQLSSHDAPSRSAQHRYSDFYTSNQDYVRTRAKLFEAFIREIGRERFQYSTLVQTEERFREDRPADVTLSTILWQNGLIGVRRTNEETGFEYYSLSRNAGFALPAGGSEYCFKSILIDAVGGISVDKGEPSDDK
ncbi:P-loop ATPase, Sll1717 family [Antarcticirhabdus aurantiaca]|uniref:Uncharacterized protein n=1 Tax=Antarcticirhabdus aurantiaca TaxID=2606717 RepID=A0ACD4NN86_9HYPH|nr:hypothetical protein [Antarcticirhabdus aurantiaca]WAJ28334.1 hypothetical protein OXU80_26565 [Jeongeuplla avenae]